MSKPAEAPAAGEKPKSKKFLLIIITLVVVLIGAGAAAFFLLQGHPEDEEEGGDATAKTAKDAKPKPKKKNPAAAPTFMPLDAVVVNLADTGSTRYAQVGITLQVEDEATANEVKKYMPAIRNGILLRISKRTADQLLSAEGKEQLANDILEFVRETTGMEEYKGYSPVEAVLFSSLIVQ